MLANDPISRVLYIDLARRKSWVADRTDLFEAALGGVSAGIRLLNEECPPGADPLDPRTNHPDGGFRCWLFPLASRRWRFQIASHRATGREPRRGRSAVAIRMAGYGAIVIRGEAACRSTCKDGDHVYFRDASALWGLHSSFTAGAVLREREKGSGERTILRIGRAGERMVTYSGVIAETYRHFGRLGLGAVFGSKQLKALVISGRRSLQVSDKKAYRALYEELYQAATDSDLMKKYHQLGTAINVMPLNAIGGLPTRNLQSGRFEGAEGISGETLAEDYLGRRVACAHCPAPASTWRRCASAMRTTPIFTKLR